MAAESAAELPPRRHTALDIDPLVVEQNRRERQGRLQKFDIPFMRWVGWNLVSIGVLLHNIFITHSFTVEGWLWVTALAEIYCAGSWVILYLYYDRARPFDLGLLFLVLDIPLWVLAIIASGGLKSWLFFILFMRVADQVNTSFQRAMIFAHLVTLAYVGMIVFLVLHGDPVTPGDAVAKTIFIYGGSVYIALSAKASSDRRERTGEVIRMARDLVRKLEERAHELKAMTTKADDANRAKSSFLANVSHEIRNPLNSILGMSQLALTSELPPVQREQMETVRASAKSLLSIIEDILDLSKIEALKIELEEVPFSIRETIFDALKALGYEAYSKGLELAGYIDPEVPDRLSGDPVRIRQIVLNLVGNAIKFTDEGSVIVGVTLEDHRPREVVIHLRVNDTGPGIPEAGRDAIFEPFSATNPGTVRKRGGTGLGLSICAKLVELMQGRIWVESDAVNGSSFHCTFTLALKAENNPRPRLLGHRTLVSDGNDSSREFIAATLETWGATVDTCDRPGEMLAALAQQTSHYDSVIIDSAWFTSEATSIQTALALMTADTRISAILPHPGDFRTANHCRSVGCHHFISRPVSEEEILETARPEEAESGATTSPALVRTGNPLEILVVDDDRINQEVTGGLLQRLGHQVTVLGSGSAAIDLLSRRHFDLMLFDVEMPKMDGLELCRQVRAMDREQTIRTPIAAVTAHAMKGDRERCLAAGMDDYLTKPIDIEELAALIRRHGSGAESPRVSMQNDSRLQKKIARLFLENSPQMVDRIAHALDAGDATDLAAAAHAIKGSAMNFDAADVVSAAETIEQLARSGAIPEARPAFDSLVKALAQLRQSLLRRVGEEVRSD